MWLLALVLEQKFLTWWSLVVEEDLHQTAEIQVELAVQVDLEKVNFLQILIQRHL
jgi:hypothetical protein